MALAAQGARNMDDGPERIEDDSLKKMLSEKVRQIQLHSFFAAVALTALAIALPD
ncbi:MAG: hypothetical protein GF310_11225 [candidate division Zixibacteria bacterium]|nr:hypothetical protein [candidate division Zixibacteria bacterium]